MNKGTLFTISAPSGAGKTSLVKALLERDSALNLSVSHTTRPLRPGEIDGRDYYFVDQNTFEALIKQDAFLEYARVFDQFYGTTKSSVELARAAGHNVLLEIDWQGAGQIRRLVPDSSSIFILPPSRSELERRLRGRGQDSEDIIARRMAAARDEISHYSEANFVVVNDEFEQALAALSHIISGEVGSDQYSPKLHQDLVDSLLE